MKLAKLLSNCTKAIFILFLISVPVLSYYLSSIGLTNYFLKSDNFVFNYLGVILGFLLTLSIVALDYISRIINKISSSKILNINSRNKNCITIERIAKEIKHNTYFIFFCLLAVISVNFWSAIDIPKFNFYYKPISIAVTKLSIFIYSLVTILDLIKTVFRLYDISLYIDKNHNGLIHNTKEVKNMWNQKISKCFGEDDLVFASHQYGKERAITLIKEALSNNVSNSQILSEFEKYLKLKKVTQNHFETQMKIIAEVVNSIEILEKL